LFPHPPPSMRKGRTVEGERRKKGRESPIAETGEKIGGRVEKLGQV